jgi:acyl-CoA reductase-like NAD-dependent aldehyde dehydrogenase
MGVQVPLLLLLLLLSLLLPSLQVVPIAIKAAFLNCGQNCASGERFIVHSKIYDKFCACVTEIANSMRQGPTLGAGVHCNLRNQWACI